MVTIAILDLTGVCHKDLIAYGYKIRKAIFRATGIPYALTKPLAKIANFAGKK